MGSPLERGTIVSSSFHSGFSDRSITWGGVLVEGAGGGEHLF